MEEHDKEERTQEKSAVMEETRRLSLLHMGLGTTFLSFFFFFSEALCIY